MTRSRFAAALALVLFSGCASPAAMPSPVLPSEAKLYTAILEDFAAKENVGIVYPHTIAPPERLQGPPLALLTLLNERTVDFTRMRSRCDPIPSEVEPKLTESEAEVFDRSAREFFDLPRSEDDEWTAVVEFSSPAYDSDNSALVYLEYSCAGPLCAGGIWYVLQPGQREWTVTSRRVVWRS